MRRNYLSISLTDPATLWLEEECQRSSRRRSEVIEGLIRDRIQSAENPVDPGIKRAFYDSMIRGERNV